MQYQTKAHCAAFDNACLAFTRCRYYGLTIYYDVFSGDYAAIATSAPNTADGLWSTVEKRAIARDMFRVAAMS